MTSCRCGKPYEETYEARCAAIWRVVGDDEHFTRVFCSLECWHRYECTCPFPFGPLPEDCKLAAVLRAAGVLDGG